jgi:hypothetical protein
MQSICKSYVFSDCDAKVRYHRAAGLVDSLLRALCKFKSTLHKCVMAACWDCSTLNTRTDEARLRLRV